VTPQDVFLRTQRAPPRAAAFVEIPLDTAPPAEMWKAPSSLSMDSLPMSVPPPPVPPPPRVLPPRQGSHKEIAAARERVLLRQPAVVQALVQASAAGTKCTDVLLDSFNTADTSLQKAAAAILDKIAASPAKSRRSTRAAASARLRAAVAADEAARQAAYARAASHIAVGAAAQEVLLSLRDYATLCDVLVDKYAAMLTAGDPAHASLASLYVSLVGQHGALAGELHHREALRDRDSEEARASQLRSSKW